MNCRFVVEARLDRNGESYWDPRQAFPEGHWRESLDVFEEVSVVARVRPTLDAVPAPALVFPANVRVVDAPYYRGPIGVLRRLPQLIGYMQLVTGGEVGFVLRVPGFLPILLWIALRARGIPYAAEVLGDGDQAFRFVQHPLRPLLRVLYAWSQRSICRTARAVLYVSDALARAYPAGPGAFTTVTSDVRLTPSMFGDSPPRWRPPEPLRIVHIGNMEHLYKGHVSLLRAMAACRDRGLDWTAVFVGDGRHRGEFEGLASELQIRDRIEFTGSLPWGTDVLRVLDNAHLFVFPSLSEGLGKALLEAMARGLPAIGSDVGGITELLPREALVPPDDAEALALRIIELASNPGQLSGLGERNQRKAREYSEERLAPRRVTFYREVKRRLAVGRSV